MDAMFEFESLVLNLEVEIVPAEDIGKLSCRRPCRLVVAFDQALGHFTLQAPGEAD